MVTDKPNLNITKEETYQIKKEQRIATKIKKWILQCVDIFSIANLLQRKYFPLNIIFIRKELFSASL